jgi:putative adenylate-forming enzyme
MSRFLVARAWFQHRLLRFASRAELQRYQHRHAQRIVQHAHAHAPFYRERLSVPSVEALLTMPTIDKATMMANFDRLNTHGVRLADAMHVALEAEQRRDFRPMVQGLTVGLSSGTSGSRGLFLVSDRERFSWAGAILERLLPGWLLSTRRDRVAFFLRANSNLYESLGSRRVSFCYFDLLEPLEQALPRLAELRPTLLVGPPSLLVALAVAQERGQISLTPERVVSVAEVLDPLDEVRIRKAFRRTVLQVYQATEGLLGTSCAYGTVHLAEDLLLFQREYVDAEQRRFVPIVSDLFRTSQPILRYRLDDVLVERREPCLCGSVLTGLERIEGRADDVFLLDVAGQLRPLYPDFVRRAVITSAPELRAYHVRQCAPDQLELFVDVGSHDLTLSKRVASALVALFESQGGTPPQVTFVPEPVRSPGAKLRRVERAFMLGGLSRAQGAC